MITTAEMQEHISDALWNRIIDGNTKMKDVTTFKDAGVVSGDAGIVVDMEDGSKFYLKIIPEPEDDSWADGMLSRVPESRWAVAGAGRGIVPCAPRISPRPTGSGET